MKIILKNHSEEYPVREIVNSFYPKQKLEFVSFVDENDNYIISDYHIESGSETIICRANINNKYEISEIPTTGPDKNNLKKSIYECLNKITGIVLPWGLMTGIRPSKIVREYLGNGGSDPIGHLMNKYGTTEEKATTATIVENIESKYIKTMYPDGISLYIGIPFCPTRCLYCSFTSQSIAFSNKLTEPYVEALKKEIAEISSTEFIRSHRIETIYFGGGTPSALDANQIDDILTCVELNFDLKYIKEITFEAGRPDTITEEKLDVLRKHSISRISINPQTTSNLTLNKIGRKHTYEDFAKSFELAKKMGFSHINSDIIAGLPDENEDDFNNTLKALCNLSPESITVHTMSIKHGSYLDKLYDTYSLTSAETVNNMLSSAQKHLLSHGMHPYYMYRQKNMLGNLENVGYCIDDNECIYNIYIMEEVQTIVALGAGGSTKLVDNGKIERVFNVKEVYEYINRIDEMINRKIKLFETFGSPKSIR